MQSWAAKEHATVLKYHKLLDIAILKWRGFDERSQLTQKDYEEFRNFLQAPSLYKPNAFTTILELHLYINVLDPEVQRKLEMLAGPHGDTLLKVMEIRNEQIDSRDSE